MQPADRACLYKGVLAAAAVAALAACAKPDARGFIVGKYAMTVVTDPSPLQVGYDAEFTVRAKPADETPDACRLAFRQFMPDHEMSADHTWHEMERLGEGLFRGRSGEFGMGGEWQVEFKLDCGGEAQLALVPYTLEWPE